jgi:signal transduction histidine kinase
MKPNVPDAPHVLLVEDNEDDAFLIEETLRNGGVAFSLTRVETLDDVVTKLRQERWDIVLSDYSLPGFTARDVLERVKECCPDTAFIVISGSVSEEVVVECVKAGARDYLMKPNLTRLPIAVDREIQETADRRLRRDLEEQLRHAQRLESLGVLAGGVAHDFNNILTGILGNASLATEILPPDSQAAPLLEAVVSASEHAALLTRQLLAYAGKGQNFVEQIDVSAVVRGMNHLLRLSVTRNISLALQLADRLPAIAADRGQIEQVVLNFVINATEAIGPRLPGGITIRTGVERFAAGPLAGNVAGDPLAGGEYVCLEVADTGPGIPPQVQARMFDPFFSTKFTGRGLGLSAALGVIRAHGGALLVRTSPGEGATFTAHFPVSNGVERRPCEPAVGMMNGLVLVIDPEEIVRRTAQTVLQQHGVSVVCAENGRDGLELFRRIGERLSLVVLDLSGPPAEVDATLGGLREMRPEMPVLITSGFTEIEARDRLDDPRAARFLQKPYGSTELARAVQQTLRENGLPRS